MRLIDADHFIATLDTVVQKHESKLWREIAETMKYMIETQAEMFPVAEPQSVEIDERLAKIADLVEGTIDHFDRDDAMDVLYQIKGVLK
jgi:hypothetical protein